MQSLLIFLASVVWTVSMPYFFISSQIKSHPIARRLLTAFLVFLGLLLMRYFFRLWIGITMAESGSSFEGVAMLSLTTELFNPLFLFYFFGIVYGALYASYYWQVFFVTLIISYWFWIALIPELFLFVHSQVVGNFSFERVFFNPYDRL